MVHAIPVCVVQGDATLQTLLSYHAPNGCRPRFRFLGYKVVKEHNVCALEDRHHVRPAHGHVYIINRSLDQAMRVVLPLCLGSAAGAHLLTEQGFSKNPIVLPPPPNGQNTQPTNAPAARATSKKAAAPPFT